MAAPARADAPERPVLRADDDARAAARVVLAWYLHEFAREEPAARGGDVEAVHQLRVATRRLRAALRSFAPMLPATLPEPAMEGFATLGRGIGAVRDLDVLALAIAAHGRRLDRDTRDALAPLQLQLGERRAAALAALVVQLDARPTRRLLGRVQTVVDRRPAPRGAIRLGDAAHGLVEPLLRAVQRAGRDLDADAPAASLHRLRVRVKRLRYVCETLAGMAEGRIDPVVERLVALQDVLGELQDANTQIRWLREHAQARPLPPETLLAMGAVVHALGRRDAKLRRRFPRLWRRFDRRRVRRLLHDALVHPEAVPPARGAATA